MSGNLWCRQLNPIIPRRGDTITVPSLHDTYKTGYIGTPPSPLKSIVVVNGCRCANMHQDAAIVHDSKAVPRSEAETRNTVIPPGATRRRASRFSD